LSQLERRGLVRSERRRIIIREPEQLEAFAFGGGPEADERQSPRLRKRAGST